MKLQTCCAEATNMLSTGVHSLMSCTSAQLMMQWDITVMEIVPQEQGFICKSNLFHSAPLGAIPVLSCSSNTSL